MSESTTRINDFAFKVATVNGTGSASANGLLLKAIYRMGIPVSGKNVFPSNIQGLPTWYEIRVSREGFLGRMPRFDLFVAMNPATYEKDMQEVTPGGWVVYDDSWPMKKELLREDVTLLGVPLARMCVDAFKGARARVLMKNIAYVGVLCALLEIDTKVVGEMVRETFARKAHLLEPNLQALNMGYDYAKEHFDCPLPIRLEALGQTKDCVMMDGNTAAALGCVYAGATVGAWYPITPATSVMDNFQALCRKYREGEEGRKYIIMQAEDELAAAGMVIGAGWAGARAFTPTSGPGISLMSEFIGLAYYAEIPSVFIDVQRTGPSTGMPTRTQQGDLSLVTSASHGDTKHIALFPADPRECFDLAVAAFDLAERFQTPVFLVSDLDIGMNDWMIPRLEWDDDYRPDRGKVLTAEQLEEMDTFYRYLDTDGDEVPYRTLPGVHPRGAYFTRGSGHDKYGKYTEDGEAYQEVVDRLLRKVDSAAHAAPAPVVEGQEGAGAGIITLGGCDASCREAVHRLGERGRTVSYLRIRAFPFHPEVRAFVEEHETVYVVEQNRDGQLRNLLALELGLSPERFVSVRQYAGYPLSADDVLTGVLGGDPASDHVPQAAADLSPETAELAP